MTVRTPSDRLQLPLSAISTAAGGRLPNELDHLIPCAEIHEVLVFALRRDPQSLGFQRAP
jgi:hypothetical protein